MKIAAISSQSGSRIRKRPNRLRRSRRAGYAWR
jgi:hypothetical protein